MTARDPARDAARADDARDAAARYRLDRVTEGASADTEQADAGPAEQPVRSASAPRSPNAIDRAAYVETAIQQAIRRGEFDDLPGAGKPLPNLGSTHDPDWWIRRKIETEQLRGLGPPAIMLRVENLELDDRLDALTREHEVREMLDDFNHRVVEARRQLLGGPPVVTPTRDVDAEVAAWRTRRDARAAAAAELAAAEPEPKRRRGFRRRNAR